MSVPSMTRGKEWLGLAGVTVAEAVLAFACFMAGGPYSYIGLALVIAANIEWIGAALLGFKNMGRSA